MTRNASGYFYVKQGYRSTRGIPFSSYDSCIIYRMASKMAANNIENNVMLAFVA